MAKPAVTGTLRLPFLPLAVVCILLAAACAWYTADTMSLVRALLVLAGGLLAHLAVNALNEYHDFATGLDARTEKSPFSGGSGVLPAYPKLAGRTLAVGIIALAGTVALGVYFVLSSPWIIPIGLAGIVLIVAYTPIITRFPWLCLVAPGTGFGLLMVNGACYVLTGRFSATALLASLTPFFLVNNLLLLNQIPDARADATVGRRHLVIVYGRGKAFIAYTGFLLCCYLSIVLGVLLGLLPAHTLPACLTLLAWPIVRSAPQADNQALQRCLAANVLIVLITPLLMAVGFIWAR